MINIGIIGTGAIAENHIQAIQKTPETKLIAVCDINRERADAVANTYNVAAYTDYSEMIRSSKLDAVIINLPHFLHKECSIYCAENKLNILLEKPLALTSDECREISQSIEKNHVKFMVGHIQRYFPENRKAKEIIKFGKLGKLAYIVDIRNGEYANPLRPRWFLEKKLAGGGIMMNLGAHSIDKILWITDSDVEYVSSSIGNIDSSLDIECHAQVFMKLNNGTSAAINLSGYKSPAFNETRFFLTNGEIRLCTGRGLWVSNGSEFVEVTDYKKIDPFELQLKEFVEYIQSGNESPIGAQYGEKVINVIEKVYREW